MSPTTIKPPSLPDAPAEETAMRDLSPRVRIARHTWFEFTMIFRQRITMLTVLIIPVALVGLAVLTNPDSESGWASMAAIWGVLVAAFSILFAIPASLSARRQSGLLKRLRTSELGEGGILISALTPYLVIGLAQVVAVVGALSLIGDVHPQKPAFLLTAVALIPIVAVALGAALAALAPDSERSQWTVFPVLLAAAGGANYILSPALAETWSQVLLALPMVSLVQLLARGLGVPEQLLSQPPSALSAIPAAAYETLLALAWCVLATVVAHRFWRWDKR